MADVQLGQMSSRAEYKFLTLSSKSNLAKFGLQLSILTENYICVDTKGLTMLNGSYADDGNISL